MIDVARIRARFHTLKFDDVCSLSVREAEVLLAVYEAACAWRDDRAQLSDTLLTRDREVDDRLCKAVYAARHAT